MKRSFEMASRRSKLTLGKAGQAENAPRGASLHRPVFSLGFAQEGFGRVARRQQFAPRIASHPPAVVFVEALLRISAKRGEFANASEGSLGLFGRKAFRPHHSLSIVGLQLQPPIHAIAGSESEARSSASSMALPRWEIASRKAERRNA